MANKPLYGANGKPIYGVGGKPVYGVNLWYYLVVVATYTSYSYFEGFFGTYGWGVAVLDSTVPGLPVDGWGPGSIPGVAYGLSPLVDHYTPRTFTWTGRTYISTDTAHASGRVHSDGTWLFPWALSTRKYAIFEDEDPWGYLGYELRVSPSTHVLAKVVGRFGDTIAEAEATLYFGVNTYPDPTSPNNYTISWTPATKTLSIV